MGRNSFHIAILTVVLSVAAAAQQAESAPATARALGTVKAISGSSLTLAPDSGAEVQVTFQASPNLVKTAPGRKDLQGATPVQLSDVQVGDRMLVRGKFAEDGKSILGTSGVLMKKEDIAQKNTREQEDWRRRGVGGVVKSVDAAGGVITVSTGGLNARTVLLHVSKDTVLRRYAPDSVKFDDAKPGPLEDIKAGDQLRARGNHSPDGGELTAEEIVSGTFRNIAGTVSSTDAATGSLTIADLLSKHSITVKVGPDSQLRKLPPMMAQGIAARLKGGSEGAPGAPPNAQAGGPPAGGFGNGGGAGPSGPGGGGARGGDFQQMLNRLPAVTISDLQKGDAVILVATEGSASVPPAAVTLLAGVEPILTSGAQAAMALSPWSLSAPSGDAGP